MTVAIANPADQGVKDHITKPCHKKGKAGCSYAKAIDVKGRQMNRRGDGRQGKRRCRSGIASNLTPSETLAALTPGVRYHRYSFTIGCRMRPTRLVKRKGASVAIRQKQSSWLSEIG